ncbi:uncharacterized protein LOC117338200 [Pecten maximus]|uniref:uncharacterized protein LOC117338200 n=1 Tax=Pecten maximus TaxID=6579 RepID=UPI001458C439|nr:uncharacterized protein LOC117338200 [Pecten maximus]
MDMRKLNYKALRDAGQPELSKQKRFLEKLQTDTEKNLCQRENTMRQQLERLQQDKERFSLEYQGKRRFSESDSHNERLRRHSFSSQLPKIADKSFHSSEGLSNQPKSHRQLKMESAGQAQASQDSIRGISKTSSTKFPKIHEGDKHQYKDRRKSMPADLVNANKEKRRRVEFQKKHQSLPIIVVTDCTCSPEVEQILSHEDRADHQQEHLPSKRTVEKNHQFVDRRSSQHGQGMERRLSQHGQERHDAKGGHQHIERLHRTGSFRKSNESLSRGSHRYMDHHDHMDDTEELTSLYDMAIQTVSSANESAFTQVQDVHKRAMPNWKDETKFPDAKQMDLSSLQELETMLKEARQYNTRKQKESDYRLHTAENRQQKRRLQFLEEILQALSGGSGIEFNPMDMLQCGYLRLSKSNIERLEHMVRATGVDPGIHAHSDVSDHDIWKELRELRQQEALEREQLQKETAGQRSRQSALIARSDLKQTR